MEHLHKRAWLRVSMFLSLTKQALFWGPASFFRVLCKIHQDFVLVFAVEALRVSHCRNTETQVCLSAGLIPNNSN